MKRAWSTIPHSTFPQGMNYFASQTEAKSSFKSRAEGWWSYCCLYFPGQRSNSVGFKGLFFYLPSRHAYAGRSLHPIPTFYKWKPRGGEICPPGYRFKPSQIFVNPNLSFPNFTKSSYRELSWPFKFFSLFFILAMLGLCFGVQAFSSCSLQGLLLLWRTGSRAGRLSSCPVRAYGMWNVEHGMWNLSSLTKDWAGVPCIGRWILNHWTTREVPGPLLSPGVSPAPCALSYHSLLFQCQYSYVALLPLSLPGAFC